jgi:hypothetical protein
MKRKTKKVRLKWKQGIICIEMNLFSTQPPDPEILYDILAGKDEQ